MVIDKQKLNEEFDSNENEEGENKHLSGVKHPLEHTWSLWLFRDVSKNWQENLTELATFNTVEDYWSIYHHIKLPSELKNGEQYSVFKQGIKPSWEHNANKEGGRWLLVLDKKSVQLSDRIWVDLVLMMIGENFEEANNSVCGAVANVLPFKSKLSVWVKDSKDKQKILKIGNIIKKVLRLPFKITFHAHNVLATTYNL